jgi:hypothetical protein
MKLLLKLTDWEFDSLRFALRGAAETLMEMQKDPVVIAQFGGDERRREQFFEDSFGALKAIALQVIAQGLPQYEGPCGGKGPKYGPQTPEFPNSQSPRILQ